MGSSLQLGPGEVAFAERALVLAGPEARTLVDPVSASELRGEAAASVHEYAAWAKEAFHRSEKQAIGLSTNLHWSGATLFRRALDDRADPWERVHQPVAPDMAKRTLRFVDYAVTTAMRLAESHRAALPDR